MVDSNVFSFLQRVKTPRVEEWMRESKRGGDGLEITLLTNISANRMFSPLIISEMASNCLSSSH